MFVPRVLQKRNAPQKPETGEQGPPAKKSKVDKNVQQKQTADTNQEQSASGNAVNASASQQQQRQRGSRFTVAPITDDYLEQIVLGIELMFSDYALQNKAALNWLGDRYRTVDGKEKYVHLSAIMEHANIVSLSPTPTQPIIQRALRTVSSESLETARDAYYVRRCPSTYPLPFLPENANEIFDDNGLSFWDQRTIYIEPHDQKLCDRPALTAWWFRKNGLIKDKWLPIQAVQRIARSCGFIVLSGNVMPEAPWKKWRDKGTPKDWIIMTKAEHTKRTKEYVELREAELQEVKKAADKRESKYGGRPLSAGNDAKPSISNSTLLRANVKSNSSTSTNPAFKDDSAIEKTDSKVASNSAPPAAQKKKKRKRKRRKKKIAESNSPDDRTTPSDTDTH